MSYLLGDSGDKIDDTDVDADYVESSSADSTSSSDCESSSSSSTFSNSPKVYHTLQNVDYSRPVSDIQTSEEPMEAVTDQDGLEVYEVPAGVSAFQDVYECNTSCRDRSRTIS